MPKPYQDWRKECCHLLKNQWQQDPISHPISVDIECFGTARGDIDNYMGALFDAGRGIVWADDRASIIQKASITYFKAPLSDSCWKIRISDI
jgi:Holliday junction resolvase RusA-like endonuclease